MSRKNPRPRVSPAIVETLETRRLFSSLSISDAVGVEPALAQNVINFTVALDAPAGGNISVNYTTTDQTATHDKDYVPAAGHLEFAPGESSKVIGVLVNADIENEPTETFTLTLLNAQGADISNDTGTGTIIDLPVRALNFSGKKKASYIDSSGDRATLSLSGAGSGQIIFLSEGNSDASLVTITGTTPKSNLIINAARSGTSFTQINIEGPLGVLSAKSTDIGGILGITGGARQIDIRNASGSINLGGTAQANINIARASELSITAPSIKNLKVAEWRDNDSTPDVIRTSSIACIQSRGDFSADPQLSAETTSLGKMQIGGMIKGTLLDAAGAIGPVTAASMLDSRIFSGVKQGMSALPTSVDDFSANSAIRSLILRKGAHFSSSTIAARSIGDLNLSKISTTAGGYVFGVCSHSISSFSGATTTLGPFRYRSMNTPQDTTQDDMITRIV